VLDDDTIIAWIGPAKVTTDQLVDIADRAAGAIITADLMLHFIVELFGHNLYQTALFQYWLVELVTRQLRSKTNGVRFDVRSDDIMVRRPDDPIGQAAKLSVSIATVSPVSGLIHLGLNVINAGTPDGIKTASLLDGLGIMPKDLAIDVIHQVTEQHKKMMAATCKVLPR